MSSRQKVVAWTAFALYAAITLWVTLHHEPWSDEAYGWILTRDDGLLMPFERAGYSGTPPLWYVLVGLLSTNGFPPLSMSLLNLAICWAAALLFLLRAPFPLPVRVLFLFSYYPAYEYAVLARPYALLMLLLFVIASNWPRRFERPFLVGVPAALLAMLTFHGLLIAAVIGLLYLIEAIRSRQLKVAAPALALLLASGIGSALLLIPPPNAVPVMARYVDWEAIPFAIGQAFFPETRPADAFPFGLAILVALLVVIGRRPVPQFFFWLIAIQLFGLFVFIWLGGLRHCGIVLLLLVSSVWLAAAYPPDEWQWRQRVERLAMAALGISLLFSIRLAADLWVTDTKEPFSGGREMGRFIHRNGLDRYELVIHPPMWSQAALAEIPDKRVWYPGLGQYGTFPAEDAGLDGQAMPLRIALESSRRRFGDTPWLYLTWSNIPEPEKRGLRLIHRTAPAFGRPAERFSLYQPVDWTGPALKDLK